MTVPAVAVKVAVVTPAATVTETGTVSAVLLSDNVTVLPPVGAAFDNVTVHVELPPDNTDVGAHWSEVTVMVEVIISAGVVKSV